MKRGSVTRFPADCDGRGGSATRKDGNCMSDKAERHEILRRIIRGGEGATQKEIKRLLADRGIVVSQATLSRDLRELGVAKVPVEGGRFAYRLGEDNGAAFSADDIGWAAGEFVTGCDDIGNFLVVRTKPGNASDFCLVLDRRRWKEIVGTIAGDDTILVMTRTAADAAAVLERIEGARKHKA